MYIILAPAHQSIRHQLNFVNERFSEHYVYPPIGGGEVLAQS